MSQKQHKPIRQDYIAKVRYSNNLPPPPLNPKFLQYNTTEKLSSKKESEQLMTSLFRKENFYNLMENLDEELGMNLNLINNNGFLDEGKESVIYSLSSNDKPIQLHPKDMILLRDAGIGKISKSEPGVSFLRRTEYIAERQMPKSSSIETVDTQAAKEKEEKHDPEAQLKAVENTFELAQESLKNFANLRHPRKKHLKAVSAWPLLPDTSMMDSKFLTLKFSGSASINREFQMIKSKEKQEYNEEFQKDSLVSAIFKPITSEDGEWISLYKLNDPKKVSDLKLKLNSTERERPVNLLDEDESIEEFKYRHYKTYDMNYQKFLKSNEELSIKFIPEENDSKRRKVAFYYPINGRIELKKHRASTNTEINKFLKDSTVDIINFKLREPSTNEIKKRDTLRSEFDPMEYEGEEEVEEGIDNEGSLKETRDADDNEEIRDVGEEFNQAEKDENGEIVEPEN